MDLRLVLDPKFLIESFGYLGLFAIIFAESGLLLGFFLPGDSLLFTAGLLASSNYLSLPILLLSTTAAAILGDNVGYAFGRKVGPKIFNKEKSFLFDKDHLLKAEKFYEQHGAKTIVLARFMPFIRTFAPIVAGVGRMNYRTFVFYNFIGAFLWAFCLPILGYFLGRTVPEIDKYLLPLIGLIVFVSVLPPLVHLLYETLKEHR